MLFKLEPPPRQHVRKMARGSKVAAAVKKFEKGASKKAKRTAAENVAEHLHQAYRLVSIFLA